MNFKKLTIAVSAGLVIYELYKIIHLLSMSFGSGNYPFIPFGQRVLSFLNVSIYYLVPLALGFCGLVLVYTDSNKDKDLDFQNRITKIRNIVFSALIIFSIWMIIYAIYSAFTSYQFYLKGNSQSQETVNVLIQIIMSIVVVVIISIGKILFGLYVITKREGLLKPFLIIYFAGFAYTLISTTYGFINSIIFNNELLMDATKAALVGMKENRISSIIISFAVDILILAAGLIIVLYGIKKRKVITKE